MWLLTALEGNLGSLFPCFDLDNQKRYSSFPCPASRCGISVSECILLQFLVFLPGSALLAMISASLWGAQPSMLPSCRLAPGARSLSSLLWIPRGMAGVQYGLRLCLLALALVVTSLTHTESKSKLVLGYGLWRYQRCGLCCFTFTQSPGNLRVAAQWPLLEIIDQFLPVQYNVIQDPPHSLGKVPFNALLVTVLWCYSWYLIFDVCVSAPLVFVEMKNILPLLQN